MTSSAPPPPAGTMLWIDFETTDLDADRTSILEVAAIVTDDRLREVGRFVTLVRPPADLLQQLNDRPVVLKMHVASGLLHDLMQAPMESLPTIAELDHLLAAFLQAHAAPDATVCVAGSGVGPFDRRVIGAQLPELDRLLTYWVIDSGCERRHYRKATGGDLVEGDDHSTAAHRAEADTENALEAARAAQEAYRLHAAYRRASIHPTTAQERALLALGMIGAFAGVDEVAATSELYAVMPDQEHVAGLVDAGRDAARRCGRTRRRSSRRHHRPTPSRRG